jgi:hypothetical protein
LVDHSRLIISCITKVTKAVFASQDVRLKQSAKSVSQHKCNFVKSVNLGAKKDDGSVHSKPLDFIGKSNGKSVFPSVHGRSANVKPMDFSSKTATVLSGKNHGDSVDSKRVDLSDKSKVNSVHFKPVVLGGKKNARRITKPGDFGGGNGDSVHGKSANVKPVDFSSKTQRKSITAYSKQLGGKIKQGDLSYNTGGSFIFYVDLGLKTKHSFDVILGGKAKDKSVIVKPNNEVRKTKGYSNKNKNKKGDLFS